MTTPDDNITPPHDELRACACPGGSSGTYNTFEIDERDGALRGRDTGECVTCGGQVVPGFTPRVRGKELEDGPTHVVRAIYPGRYALPHDGELEHHEERTTAAERYHAARARIFKRYGEEQAKEMLHRVYGHVDGRWCGPGLCTLCDLRFAREYGPRRYVHQQSGEIAEEAT